MSIHITAPTPLGLTLPPPNGRTSEILENYFFIPNFLIDAMESNLCSVLLILSIISIPTALLNLYGKNKAQLQ